MHSTPIGGLTESPFELVGGNIERLVEVLGTSLAAHDRAAGTAGDLDVLAAAVLPPVAFVMQFDVCADDLLVISLDLAELLRDVKPEMVRDLDVAPVHHNLHGASTVDHGVAPTLRTARRRA